MRSFLEGLLLMFVFFAGAATVGLLMRSDLLEVRSRCDQFEREAVQHGAARWIVDDEGRREFVWNESGVRDGE